MSTSQLALLQVLVFLGGCHGGFVMLMANDTDDINGALTRLGEEVLERYFSDRRCMVAVREVGLSESLVWRNTIADFQAESSSPSCVHLLHAFFKITFRDNCDGYLVQLKEPRCALDAWQKTNRQSFVPRHNPRFFFLPLHPDLHVFADDVMSHNMSDITQDILAAELEYNESDWRVVLYTNNFYRHTSEEDRDPKIYLDEWHRATGFDGNVNHYPDKVKNLQGKPFRVWVDEYLPYATYENFDGFEVRIARAFCEVHNCTAKPVTDEYLWGTVYPNLTGQGALGSVYMDDADIGAFAVYLWIKEFYYIDYSDSYLRGEVTVMTPKPTRIGGWLTPFLPFSLGMWLAFFISLGLSAFSLYFVNKFSINYTRFRELLLKKNQFTTIGDSLLRSIGLVVLQQPSSRLIGDSPIRYLFTSFEFLYLVLSAMYSAELAAFLTIPQCDGGFVMPMANDNDDINGALTRLGEEVMERYFSDRRCMVAVREIGLSESLVWRNTIADFQAESSSPSCVHLLHAFFKITFRNNCDGYLVQLKEPRCALDAWQKTNRQSFVPRHNPRFFFLPLHPELHIFADDVMSHNMSDITQDILAAELEFNESDWKVSFYTNNFFQHTSVEDRGKKIYLDEWHRTTGFKRNNNLYPNKIKNLKGKDFRVWVDEYLPFASYEKFDGFEVRIPLAFCEIHNCTAKPVTDDHLWGTIYPNLTGQGALGSIYMDDADVGAFAVYLWIEESYYIDYSDSYLRGEVTVMTPKPTRIGGWHTPFLPFSPGMWVATFISICISAASLYLINKVSINYTRFRELLLRKDQFTTISDSLLRSIGLVVLQQPSSRLIGDSPIRYLFTSFEFLYLVLSAMYSAELAAFLTIPQYNPPIDKFHDFAESGITWYATHEAFTYSLRESPDHDAQTIVKHFKALPMDELKRSAKLGKYGFTAERCPGGSITEQEHITADVIPNYHIMKDYLFGSPLVVSIRKGGPYNKAYNKVVNRAVEHGLTLYWEAEVARLYLNNRVQAEYQEAKTIHVDSEPSVIQISNIIGVIYIYVIGISFSSIAFFYELSSKWTYRAPVKKM